MKRRNFLGLLAGAGAVGALAPISTALAGNRKTKDPIKEAYDFIGPSMEALAAQRWPEMPALGSFSLLYLAGQSKKGSLSLVVVDVGAGNVARVISLPQSTAHAVVVTQNSKLPLAMITEYGGAKASLVNYQSGKVVSTAALNDAAFSGHGCFSPDGKIVYVSENKTAGDKASRITARSTENLKVLRVFETGGHSAHDTKIDPSGKFLYVGHHGQVEAPGEPLSRGDLVIVDLSSGSNRSISFLGNSYLALSHFIFAGKQLFITGRSSVEGNELLAPLLYSDIEELVLRAFSDARAESRLRFNFSLCHSSAEDMLAINHTAGKAVTFWRASNREFLSSIALGSDEPLGLELTPDGRHFLVNVKSGHLYVVSVKDRRVIKKLTAAGIGFSAHIQIVPG